MLAKDGLPEMAAQRSDAVVLQPTTFADGRAMKFALFTWVPIEVGG